MKNPVNISIDFKKFKTLKINNEIIYDFQTAISIVKASNIKNVRLEQDNSTNVESWDNF